MKENRCPQGLRPCAPGGILPKSHRAHKGALQCHILGKGLHIPHNGRIENAGIMAGHLRIGVPEHFSDIFDSRTAGKGQRCKSVAGSVSREMFFDSADVGQFLEVTVHLLVATNGQQHVVRLTIRIIMIASQYFLCGIQQRDIAHISGFLTCFANPLHPVNIRRNMLCPQLFYIRKCQPRQTTECEDVPNLCQAGNVDRFIEKFFQLMPFKKVPFDLLFMKTNLRKRVS